MGSCNLCPLHLTAQTVCVPGRGNGKIMLVVDAPDARSDFAGETLAGPVGQYLTGMLRDAGFNSDDVYLTNTVKCAPPGSRGSLPAEINTCRIHLISEVLERKPEVIIAAGNVALNSLCKLSGIKVKRGQGFPLHKSFDYDCEVWPTYSPSYVMFVPQSRATVVSDLRRIRDRTKPPDKIDWKWWDGSDTSPVVGFDIETDYDRKTKSGGDNMTQCALAGRDVVWVAKDAASHDLARSLQGKMVFTLNGWNFDNPKCRALGIAVPHGIDVTALAYLDDENQPLGLESLAVKYLGVRGWKDEREAPPGSDAFAIYNARDARHTLDLARHFFKHLGNSRAGAPRTRIVTDIMAPARLALDACSHQGIPLNGEAIESHNRRYSEALERAEHRVRELSVDEGLNPNSTRQVSTILTARGHVLPHTPTGLLRSDDAVLRGLGDDFATAILDYRGAKKALSTYILPYQSAGQNGGRVHPEFTIWRTVTGRTSARNPNTQNVPQDLRNKKDRSLDIFVGQEVDYSAIEFRLAAWCAQERGILDRFAENPAWDPHRYFASMFYHVPENEVTDAQRRVAKTGNFEYLYLGVVLPNKLNQAWHRTFPRFHRWYREVEAELKEFGYVESATGFRRHYGDFNLYRGGKRAAALREAINVKVQGLAAHIALLGLSECHRRGYKITNFVHDSVMFDESPNDFAGIQEGIREALCMVPIQTLKERFNVNVDVPLLVEFS
jgi:uracil-DNA glycosylase family 4